MTLLHTAIDGYVLRMYIRNNGFTALLGEQMKLKIKDIATVQMGYTFRSRLEATNIGNTGVIQMKDLHKDNTVKCHNLMKIDNKTIKGHHLAQKGDLVFRSRGHTTTAAIILKDPGRAAVAAPLLRIRVTQKDKIIPEYLNWYISQRDAQVFLTSRAKGTVQKMISKQAIEELEVSLPSLEKQKTIVELATLAAKEQRLLRTQAEKRKQFISTVLMQYAKGKQT